MINKHLKTSEKGLSLIKKFEGLRLTSYLCPANVWTIGYGTTSIKGKPVTVGMKITEQMANEYLKEDVKKFEEAIKRNVKVNLTQGQFDALVSFIYNLGEGSLKQSTLLKVINNGEYNKAPKEFIKWVYANKKKLEGLVKRREAEIILWNS